MPALNTPAAERNKEPILAVLRRALPPSGLVLEIASGTGQHVVHFARALPGLTWQPSDPQPEMLASIAAWAAEARLLNLCPPLLLDVEDEPWPVAAANAVLCINMVHIAPWKATLSLMRGAARVLARGGVLVLYGPFRRDGCHTAPSNERFDLALRGQDARWGVRDLEAVAEAAQAHGLDLGEVVEMPANNLMLVFGRAGAPGS